MTFNKQWTSNVLFCIIFSWQFETCCCGSKAEMGTMPTNHVHNAQFFVLRNLLYSGDILTSQPCGERIRISVWPTCGSMKILTQWPLRDISGEKLWYEFVMQRFPNSGVSASPFPMMKWSAWDTILLIVSHAVKSGRSCLRPHSYCKWCSVFWSGWCRAFHLINERENMMQWYLVSDAK